MAEMKSGPWRGGILWALVIGMLGLRALAEPSLKAPSSKEVPKGGTCSLTIQANEGFDLFNNSIVNRFTGHMSDGLSPEELGQLKAKGYDLTPKKIQFTSMLNYKLGETELALQKHAGVHVWFITRGLNHKSFALKLNYKSIVDLPKCEALKQKVRYHRLQRRLFEQAARARASSIGETILTLEAMEQNRIGLPFSEEDLNQSIAGYQALLAAAIRELNEMTKIQNQSGASIDDPFARVQSVRSGALKAGLTQYVRAQTALSRFVSGEGANCVARTVTILSLLRDLKIEPPSGWKLGAELYFDHIQPVLVNVNSQVVIDLISNQKREKLTQPIYSVEGLLNNAFRRVSGYRFKLDGDMGSWKVRASDAIFLPPSIDLDGLSGVNTANAIDQVSSNESAELVRIDVFNYLELPALSRYSNEDPPVTKDESHLLELKVEIKKSDSEQNDQSGATENGNTNESLFNGYASGKPYFDDSALLAAKLKPDESADYARMVQTNGATANDLKKYSADQLKEIFNSPVTAGFLKGKVLPPLIFSGDVNYSFAALSGEWVNTLKTNQGKDVQTRSLAVQWRVNPELIPALVQMTLSDRYKAVHSLSRRELRETLNNAIDQFKTITTVQEFLTQAKSQDFASSIKHAKVMIEWIYYLDGSHESSVVDLSNDKEAGHLVRELTIEIQRLSEIFEVALQNAHASVLLLDDFNDEDWVNLENVLDQYLLLTYGLNANQPKWLKNQLAVPKLAPRSFSYFKSSLLNYLLRSKNYLFTHQVHQRSSSTETEVGSLGGVRDQALVPRIDLPTVPLPKGISLQKACLSSDPFFQVGFMAYECPKKDSSFDYAAFQDPRERIRLKSSTVVNMVYILGGFTSERLSPVNLMFFHLLIDDELKNQLNRDDSIIANEKSPYNSRANTREYFLRSLSRVFAPSVASFDRKELESAAGSDGEPCKFKKTREENERCYAEFSAGLHNRGLESQTPSWVRENRRFTPYFLKLKALKERELSEMDFVSARAHTAKFTNGEVRLEFQGSDIPKSMARECSGLNKGMGSELCFSGNYLLGADRSIQRWDSKILAHVLFEASRSRIGNRYYYNASMGLTFAASSKERQTLIGISPFLDPKEFKGAIAISGSDSDPYLRKEILERRIALEKEYLL